LACISPSTPMNWGTTRVINNQTTHTAAANTIIG
jgi:hypothetical protein